MNTREMVCIRCPLGCRLTVTEDKGGQITVAGNTCPRGKEYGIKEWSNPTRMLTTTVGIKGVKNATVSVKTASDIPKGKMMECMKELSLVEVVPPIHIGDVIIENVAGTGQAIVATREYEG